MLPTPKMAMPRQVFTKKRTFSLNSDDSLVNTVTRLSSGPQRGKNFTFYRVFYDEFQGILLFLQLKCASASFLFSPHYLFRI